MSGAAETPGQSAWASDHKLDVDKYKNDKSIELIRTEVFKTRFEDFDERAAYILGSTIRELYYAQNTSTGILITIRLFSGLTIFQLACGVNVHPTNEDWVRRKYNTVRDFGVPTLQKGKELQKKGRDINSLGEDYAAHGGGFPIAVKNCSVPIGAIIVSGLTQELDHALIVDSLLHMHGLDVEYQF